MTRRLIVTQAAESDLAEVYDGIAESSPRAAGRMLVRLQARFEALAEAPESGRIVDELRLGLRRVNEGVYAIFYRVAEDEVQIARVIHGMRDLPARFRE